MGFTWATLALGMKFFSEVLKGVGVITLGGATAAGMALDAVLCGVVTYELGYTTKTFLDNGKKRLICLLVPQSGERDLASRSVSSL